MKTYCNPLSITDLPEGRWLDAEQTGADLRSITDYRSVSDPSVIYHDGKWILYPSYAVAYVPILGGRACRADFRASTLDIKENSLDGKADTLREHSRAYNGNTRALHILCHG